MKKSFLNGARKGAISILCISLLILCACSVLPQDVNEPAGEEPAENSAELGEQASEDVYDPNLSYAAKITVKDHGTITVALDGEQAPITVENFVKLAKAGFYDGLTFHRIMAGFMMQGGCPDGNGSGGADEDIKGEFMANGVVNKISHTRGTISMARANDPNSASSQFFIVHQDSTFLDGQYAGFGTVTDGMDIVDAVCEQAKPIDANGTIPKDDQPVIESITIEIAE